MIAIFLVELLKNFGRTR